MDGKAGLRNIELILNRWNLEFGEEVLDEVNLSINFIRTLKKRRMKLMGEVQQ